MVLVDNHAGATGVAVGVQAGPGNRVAGIDIDYADTVPRAFGLVGREPHCSGRRVAKEQLWHRVVVGGDCMRSPLGTVDRLPDRAGSDRRGRYASLVFALVGKQRVVVDVA